ncbi:UNVERIFIED_CONTAM: hypothetical protein GTU68_014759 [Idotea baltica]|nr:hypothetical protein [Idotea baltica]
MLEHKPFDNVLSDAATAGVSHMICIGAADGFDSATRAIKFAEGNANIFASVGLHPHDAAEGREVEQFLEQAQHEKVVAVGECGLDFFRDWSPVVEQERVFIESIALAKQVKKPLIIHCRDAHPEAIEILEKHKASEVGGVFHCYAQSAEFAAKLADMGFLISLTGILTFNAAKEMQAEVAKIPLEQIMLETDCPYMAPTPYRGKPSEPAHVLEIAKKLADIKEVSLKEVAKITTANAKRLFKLPI